MPRYDYRCSECGHAFELRQSFSSEPVAECPDCAGLATRQFHAPPVFFKGSGWYVNDYGKGRNNGAGDKDKGDKDKKEVKASTSEDKSSPKAESGSTSDKSSSSGAKKSD